MHRPAHTSATYCFFINRTDAAGVWGANIGGAGTITIVGTGTTTITGANTYTGPLLVNAGKPGRGQRDRWQPEPNWPDHPWRASWAITARTTVSVVAATIFGGGARIDPGGQRRHHGDLENSNSYTGGTIFAAGELEVDSLNAIGTTGLLSFTGGALRYSATNTSNYPSRFSTAPGQLYAFDTNGQTITFTSPLTSTGNSALTKLGAGTLVLTTTNAYSNTNVNGGVLLSNLGVAGLGSGNINFGGPGTLALNTGGTITNTLSPFLVAP